MELSGKLEYAVLALLALADSFERNQPLQIRQIATLQNIPPRYLEQILTVLRRGGLIKRVLGKHGGICWHETRLGLHFWMLSPAWKN
jgi:Rrf2 family protein